MITKEIEKTRDFVTRAAERYGWVVNPDTEHLADVIEGLSVNLSRFNYYLCPCRDGSGDRKTDTDIICPCTYAAADLDEYGHCYCGLFFTPAYAESGNPAEPIPERRNAQQNTSDTEPADMKASDSQQVDKDTKRSESIESTPIEAKGDLCSIKDLIREINELEDELKSVHKLTLNEAICLCCISKLFRSPTECAEQMGLSPSRISRILNSLEKKKLIERRMKQDNHRSTELRLTELGSERLRKLRMCGFSFSKLDKGASIKNR